MAGTNEVLVEFGGKDSGLGKESKTQKENVKGVGDESKKTDEELKKVGNTGEESGKKLSSGMKIGVAAIAAATVAASAMVGKLAKDAIDAYADYEQLSGGVDKLFGGAADAVKASADTAYKTAGMSANAYMENVTGFSASLISGLKGDTTKAAELANVAISDMSDNANTYGTDMESIQRTYQGFAKGQFGMLDNLKLGYGGSQAEMARLINDSGVLGDTMVTAADVSKVSMDKIIEAVHKTQENMGIAGTTAKEAASTISGSLASTQAAWTNVMASFGTGSDMAIEQAVNGLIESAGNFVSNISKILPDVLGGVSGLIMALIDIVPDLLADLLPAFIDGIVRVLKGLVGALPGLLKVITKIVPKLVQGFAKILISLLDAAPEIISGLLKGIVAIFKAVFEPKTLTKIIKSLSKALIGIVHAITDILKNPEALNTILQGAVTLLLEIVKALPEIIVALVEALPILIKSLVAFLTDPKNLGLILQAMLTLGWELLKAIPLIIKEILKAFGDLVPGLGDFFKGIGKGFWAWLKEIPAAFMKVMTAIKDAAVVAWNWIYENVIKPVIDLVVTYFNLVVLVWSTILNAIKVTAQTIWNAILAVIKTVIDTLVWYFNLVVTVWSTILNAIKTAATTIWDFIWNNIIKPVVDFIVGYFTFMYNTWNTILTTIKTVATTIWNTIQNTITGVVDKVKAVWNGIVDWFKDKWDKIKEGATAIKDGIVNAVKGAFETAKEVVKKGINWIIDKINKIIQGFNKVAGKIPGIDLKISEIPELARGGYVGYGDGGAVRGRGSAMSDSIPAMLSNGEYVMRASAVKNLGVDALDMMNKGKSPQGSGVHIENVNVKEEADALALAQQIGAMVRFK
jgi:phage-related protein